MACGPPPGAETSPDRLAGFRRLLARRTKGTVPSWRIAFVPDGPFPRWPDRVMAQTTAAAGLVAAAAETCPPKGSSLDQISPGLCNASCSPLPAPRRPPTWRRCEHNGFAGLLCRTESLEFPKVRVDAAASLDLVTAAGRSEQLGLLQPEADPRSRLVGWKAVHFSPCGSKQPTRTCSASVIAWWVNPSKVQESDCSASAPTFCSPGRRQQLPVCGKRRSGRASAPRFSTSDSTPDLLRGRRLRN